MMWSMVASGVILGFAALRLRYNRSSDSIDEAQTSLARGFGVALGAAGLYLFVTSIFISFNWSFASISGGVYDILFGGVGALGGLVLLAVAAALYLGKGIQAITYFAFVLGCYLISDAWSIMEYSLTSDPTKSTLLYLAAAAPLLISPFAFHIQNKYARWVFAIFAFLFAAAWFYFALTVTPSHLGSTS
jgi:uncharacterized membrane protein